MRANLTLGAATFLVGLASSAFAYPQWQLSTGATRCNQCHFAPGGGGLVTGYGRDAIGEELSTFRGDGAFLHGAVTLPSRLALGASLRGAYVAHDPRDREGTKHALFPMQADLQARVDVGGGVSFFAVAGLRGQVREDNEVVPLQNYQPISTSRLVSREHFVTWQPATQGLYARLGRFHAPFGLRLAEHVTYVRRDLGFGLLEETYNLSGGYVVPEWELHLTGFAPDFVRHIGGREGGLAVLFERRLSGDTTALGAQGKVGVGPGMTRLVAGATGKHYLAPLRLMLLAELNVVHQVLDSPIVGDRDQLVGAAGVAALPVRGLIVTLLGERSQSDLRVPGTAWNAGTALVSWFPYPHVELQLAGRLQFVGGGDVVRTFLTQVHYFL